MAKLTSIMDDTSHTLHRTEESLSSSFTARLRPPQCRKELLQVIDLGAITLCGYSAETVTKLQEEN